MHQDQKITTAQASPPLADILHNRYTAWVVLLISLAITLVAWKISNDSAEQRTLERFKFQVNEAQFAIEQRMIDYQQVLRGGLALFESAQQVDRSMWQRYIKTLELDKNYPGIQGIGYAQWVLPEDRASVEQSVRDEGFPEFTIKPPGERDHYTSIIYLEPFDTRNRRAFGYDMYSEPTRRAAMDLARDSGEASISGNVKLLQETATDIQAGFLMYLPLYSEPVTQQEERRKALRGFVYSPFRAGDLMQGILGLGSPELNFEIYDGHEKNSQTLLYDSATLGSNEHSHPHAAAHRLQQSHTFTIANHTWTINYSSTPALELATTTSQPLMVAIGGVAIDLLLFYIIISLSGLRHRANQLANERMDQLRERELHFKTITDTAHDGIITSSASGDISYCNRAAEEILGHRQKQLLGTSLVQLFNHKLSADSVSTALTTAVVDDHTAPIEIESLRKDGSTIPLELSIAGWSVGKQRYATTIVRDITERKRVDRMKNEFISTVSHELRTPLTSIKGSLGLLSAGVFGQLPAPAQELVDIAQSNSERLVSLVNDLLDIEKLEFGQLSIQLTDTDLRPLLQQALKLNQGYAESFKVQLRLDDSALPAQLTVAIDSLRLQQVLSNLISNAVKF
ncbi:MAG: CHASE domain-containing protein, partial [Pseudomonadota bacterium]|nr:CHASE domain-containing protein [Pseudomonadota bacterium]